ncbi:MAG: sulfatase-like hydrolase/transferase [Pirellulales bacterium]
MLIWNPASGRVLVIIVTLILTAPLWFSSAGKPSKTRSLGNALLWALVLAAVSSVAQIAIRQVKLPLVNPFVAVGRDVLAISDRMWWIVPISQTCGLVLLVLSTWGVSQAVRGIDFQRALVFLVLLAIVFDTVPLILNGAIDGSAELLLIFGLVTSGMRSRWLRARFDHPPKAALVIIALATLVGLPAGFYAVHFWARRPQPPFVDKPNVLLITLDTVRKQNLSLYGYSRPTTLQFEKLAQRGALYTNAIAPSSWTLPTHASIFTSLLPFEHGAEQIGRGLPPGAQTLAGTLQEQGYATAAFIANEMCGQHTGLTQGFQDVDELKPWWCGSIVTASAAQFLRGMPRRTAADINQSFLGWLNDHDKQPFFAFVNYYDAHSIYEVPDPAFDRFATTAARLRRNFRMKWSIASLPFQPNEPAEQQYALDTYDGAISYLDDQVGKLFDSMQEMGLLDNTIVMVTNDHGEHFGENGKWEHSDSVYRQLIEAPLIVVYPPKIPAGTVIAAPVTLTQIPATVLELAGLDPAPNFRNPSLLSTQPVVSEKSAVVALTHQWPGSDAEPREQLIFSETCPNQEDRSQDRLCSLIAFGWHYIRRCSDGHEELYDYRADPLDLNNLANEPTCQAKLQTLRGLMLQYYPGRETNQVAAAQPPTSRGRVATWPACRCGCCRPPGSLGLFFRG